MDDSRRASPVLAILVLAAVLLLPGPAHADHSGGNDCYGCHTLAGAQVQPGTSYVSTAAATPSINNGWDNTMKFGCTFCHRDGYGAIKDALTGFISGKPSSHPVYRRYTDGATTTTPWLSTDNSATPNVLDCIDCHDPLLVTYPNHNPSWLDNTGGSAQQRRNTNPFALRNVTDLKRFDNLCRSCHNPNVAVFPSGKTIGKNIASITHTQTDNTLAILENDGTPFKTTALAGAGTNRECSVCHDTHESNNQNLFSDGTEKSWTGASEANVLDPGANTAASNSCVNVCHYPGGIDNGYLNHGHGKATSYRGTTMGFVCTQCHNDALSHQGTAPDYKTRNRLSATPDTTASIFSTQTTKSVCYVCHPSKEAHKVKRTINGSQNVGCVDCHDEHAESSGSNVMMIRSTNKVDGNRVGQAVPPGTETVTFVDTMRYPVGGDNVFDYYKGAADTTGFCDQRACHGSGSNASVPFIPLSTYLTSNAHTGNNLPSGYDCESCHTHDEPQGSYRALSACDDCHGQPPPPGDAGYTNFFETKTAHLRHAGTDDASRQYGKSCTVCHYKYTDPSTHNTTSNPSYQSVFFDNTWVIGSSSYDNVNFQCGNLYCHSDGRGTTRTVQWALGVSTPNVLGCDGCHDNAALLGSGSHRTHLGTRAGLVATYGFTCNYCHYGTAASNTAIRIPEGLTGHVNKLREVLPDASTIAGTFSYDNVSRCSNLYCHGTGTPVLTGGAAQASTNPVAPTWADNASTRCGSCHGAPGATTNFPGSSPVSNWPTTSAHPTHAGSGAGQLSLACAACHKDFASQHANRLSEVAFDNAYFWYRSGAVTSGYTGTATVGDAAGGCENIYCHSTAQDNVGGPLAPAGYRTPSWAGPVACGDCHDADGVQGNATLMASGSHTKHLGNNYPCGSCHNGAGDNTALHVDNAIQVALNPVFDAGTFSYSQSPNRPGNGYGSCSATTCHGTGTPSWGTALTNDCASCHSDMGAGGYGSPVYTPSHQTHTGLATDGTPGYQFACEQCHAKQNLLTDNNTRHAYGVVSANQGAEVKFLFNDNAAAWQTLKYGQDTTNDYYYRDLDANPYTGGAASIYYSAGTSLSGTDTLNASLKWTKGTCQNIWCHSGANPVGGQNVYRNPVWDNAFAADCTGCHNGDAASALPMTGLKTGADNNSPVHRVHAIDAGFGCVLCHNNTVTDNRTIKDRRQHVDGEKDVAFTTLNTGATVYNLPLHQCANLYCHSSGADTPAYRTVPRWDNNAADLDCSGCHGTGRAGRDGMPDYPNVPPGARNTHATHVDTNGITCSVCHYATTTTDNTITGAVHVDGVKNVAFDNTTATGDYVNATKTCTVSCHNDVQEIWGNPLVPSADCSSCHSGTSGDVEDFVYLNGNKSLVDNTQYYNGGHGSRAVGCMDCHNSAVSHNNPSNIFRLVNTDLQALCSNAACHSGAASSAVRNHSAFEMETADSNFVSRYDGNSVNNPLTANWTTFTPKCVDCHDPHGDRAAGESVNNLYMIQRELFDLGSDAAGRPNAPRGDNIVFTDNTGLAYKSYAWSTGGSPNYSGVCQECHTQTVAFKDNLTADVSPHPAPATFCLDCHKHGEGFKPSGCNGCHGSTVTGQYWPDGAAGSPPYADDNRGAHDNHVLAIGQYLGYGDFAVSMYLDNQQKTICAFCHRNPGEGGHGSNGGSDNTVDLYNASGPGNYFKKFVGAGAVADDNTTGANPYNTSTKSCANLACHNQVATPSGASNWNVPPNWASGINSRCSNTSCHATGTFPAGSYTLSHPKHVEASQKNYACTVCHPDNGTNLRHTDGRIQMAIGGLEGTVGGGNGYYDKDRNGTQTGLDNNFAYKTAPYGSCRNIYCHGGDNASWGGSNTVPAWDNASTGACGTCHDTDAADTTPSVLSTGNHPAHIQAAYGPQSSCAACHPAYAVGSPYHVSGAKEFQNNIVTITPVSALGNTAPAGAPDNGSTDRCNKCHSTATVGGAVGTVLAKTQWDNNVYKIPCLSCHNAADAAWDNAAGTGIRAPSKDSFYSAAGHGLDNTGSYPATGNSGARLACVNCHSESSSHISGVLSDADRLDGGYSRDTVCDDCHATGTPPASLTGTPAVKRASKHSRTVTGKYSGVAAYDYSCVACHDPHGTSNLAMIHTTIVDNMGDNATGVSFTGSLANLDPSGPDNGVCDRCHYNSAPPHPDTRHPGNHNEGSVCIKCHDHGNSFAGSCVKCHGNSADNTVWPDNIDNNPERVLYSDNDPGSHTNHIGAIGGYLGFGGNPTTYNLDNQIAVCAFCHPNPGSGTHDANDSALPGGAGRVDVYNQTQGGYFRKYTGGGGHDNDTSAGWNYAYDNLSCQNLVCHNRAESPRGANNWNNPPNWSAGLDNQCQNTTCHGTGTYLNRAQIDNNSHSIHVNDTSDGTYPGRDYACKECHVDPGTNLRHQTGLVEMKFNNAGTLEGGIGGGTGYYDKNRSGSFEPGTDNVFAYKTGSFGLCRNIYCHGGDNASWGGNNITPEWNNPSTSGCYRPSPGGAGSCHAAYGSPYSSSTQGGLYRPRNPLVTGFHQLHFRQYDSGGQVTPASRGPLADPHPGNARGCEMCHPVDTGCATSICHNTGLVASNPVYDITRHVDGQVWLNQANEAAKPTYATKAASAACDHCHSTANVGGQVGRDLAKVQWDNASYLLPCLACHNGSDPATSRYDGGLAAWVSGPNVLAPAKDNAWSTGGHGRTGNYPATNNPGANLACATCHAEQSPHITGVLNDNVRLDNSYTAATICDDCHHVTAPPAVLSGSPATKRASRHASSVTGNYAGVPQYDYNCVVCHDAHGTGNLAMIQPTITDNLGAAATNVVFTGSLANLDPDNTADNGVCDRCHADGGQAHAVTNHPGNHNFGTVCTNCHNHTKSFLGSCTTCHGNDTAKTIWPDNQGANNPNRVVYADDNVGAHNSHILAIGSYLGFGDNTTSYGTTDQMTTCGFCHPNPGAGGHETNVPGDLGGSGRANVYNTTDNASAYFKKFTGGGAYVNDTSAGWNYSYVTRSCANLVCHNQVASPSGANHWDNPPDWTVGMDNNCSNTTCHAGAAFPTGMYTNVHEAHVDPAQKALACTECHTANGTNLRHTDGRVGMAFNNPGSMELVYGGGNGAYAKGSSFAYKNGTYNYQCSNIYCHGGDNAWGGRDTTPVWDNYATGGCGSCHGDSPDNTAPHAVVATGSHPTHFNTVYGPGLIGHPGGLGETSCTKCHNINTAAGCNACHRMSGPGENGFASKPTLTHVDGKVDLARSPADNTAVLLSGTDICNNCHGGPTPSTAAKGQWANQTVGDYTNVTCQSCHGEGEYRANSKYDNTGLTAPDGWSRYMTRGHGSGSLPVSNKSANRACTDCHTYTSGTHIDNLVRSNDRVTAVGDARCSGCHPGIRTHSNNPGNAFKTEANFTLACDDCHNPHGTSNIFMVGTIEGDNTVYNSAFPASHSGIAFYSLTGADSFDEDDNGTANDDSPAQNADDICASCHYDNGGLAKHSGGGRADNVAGHTSSFKGQNCVTCHSHSFTAGGFMPEQCNACHDYPGLTASGRHALSGKHARHANAIDNSGKAYTCSTCHFDYGPLHNQQGVLASDNTTWDAQDNNVSVQFDNAANPTESGGTRPSYNGNKATAGTFAPGTAANNGACAGLWCHGNNADLQTAWAGTNETPAWSGTLACGDCHGATASSGNLLATGSHPTHFNAAYGPGIDNNAGCTSCHVDFSNTGVHSTHVNGSRTVDLRTAAADNTVTTKAGTAICNNCHGIVTYDTETVKAQWDNQTVGNYANVTCESCHGGGDKVAHTTAAGTGGSDAPHMMSFWTASGHGKTGIQKGCADCHGYTVQHYGALSTANPWRLIQPAAATGDLDAFCANPVAGCHAAAPLDHFWNVAKSQAKAGTETHPTSTRAYPDNTYKQRWLSSSVTDDNVVFSGDITAYPHLFASGSDLVVCVSCHDPHGVGASRPSTRKFAGSYTDNVDEQHMLRFNYRTGAPAPLCALCHK